MRCILCIESGSVLPQGFDNHTVMELMIDEIKNFDLEVFLHFKE